MNCLNTLLVYPFDFEWVLSVVKHGTVIDRQRAYRYRLLPVILRSNMLKNVVYFDWQYVFTGVLNAR